MAQPLQCQTNYLSNLGLGRFFPGALRVGLPLGPVVVHLLLPDGDGGLQRVQGKLKRKQNERWATRRTQSR